MKWGLSLRASTEAATTVILTYDRRENHPGEYAGDGTGQAGTAVVRVNPPNLCNPHSIIIWFVPKTIYSLHKAHNMIQLKRVYEPAAGDDGFRILVERLWPRGFSKQRAQVDLWLKDVAPSPELRSWYAHDLEKWDEFQKRYQAELRTNPAVEQLRAILREKQNITFVYSARDEDHNSALVLKGYLEHA